MERTNFVWKVMSIDLLNSEEILNDLQRQGFDIVETKIMPPHPPTANVREFPHRLAIVARKTGDEERPVAGPICEESGMYTSDCPDHAAQRVKQGNAFPRCPECFQPVTWTRTPHWSDESAF